MKYQTSTLLLLAVLALSLFLRTYNISRNLHFTGDEGRDALIALDIAQGKNYPILGPSSSVGKLSLGPLYYYLIAPFALIDKTNPVFLAVPVIFFSVLTSALLYFVAKELGKSRSVALLSALFYAVSPWAVTFGRFSWNPNIMPFFSLLYFYALWKAREHGRWFIVAAVSFGVMIQSHYVSLIALPLTLFFFWNRREIIKKNYKYIVLGGVIFAFMLSPLIFYDLSRNFKNLRGLLTILQVSSGPGLEAHYFELLWPFLSIAFAYVAIRIIKTRKIMGTLLTTALIFLMLRLSVKNVTTITEPSLAGIKEVVSWVKDQSGGTDFNFAVLSSVNREDSYKYFFKQESLLAQFETATEQLFVVCEGEIDCSPHGHPKYEIAIFDVKYNGQVETAEEWNVRDYYKIVKLVPKK